jgi:hypothetical protein
MAPVLAFAGTAARVGTLTLRPLAASTSVTAATSAPVAPVSQRARGAAVAAQQDNTVAASTTTR